MPTHVAAPMMHTTVRIAALEGLDALVSAGGIDHQLLLRQQGMNH